MHEYGAKVVTVNVLHFKSTLGFVELYVFVYRICLVGYVWYQITYDARVSRTSRTRISR